MAAEKLLFSPSERIKKILQMENRSQRLALITNIIQNEDVESQSNLLEKLRAHGCEVTQATLSRDLKLLKIFRRFTNDGRYLYALQGPSAPEPGMMKAASSAEGFLSMEFAGNLAVIRTVPAFAQPISQAIDDMNMPSVISTIAGNDTILLVIRNGFSEVNVMQDFENYFPEFASKIHN